MSKKFLSLCLSIVIVCSCFTCLSAIDVSAATSTNWSWPTSVHTIKSDWPTYSSGSYHGGTDFPVALNSPVYSTCDGEVVAVTSLTTSYGKHIKIKAVVNGSTVYMRYCHLNSFVVSVGDKVSSGQLIAYSGSTGNSTGPHLHYEVRNANDYYGNSSSPNLNPRNYLPGTSYSFETDENPPTNVSISKNQVWYDLKDTIEIYMHADNATSYYMSMFKDGQKIISQDVSSGKFSMPASTYGIGNYSVYFSCTNSTDISIDSSWIDFSVVGPATYTNVYASNWWYDLSDTVSITVDPVCSKGQVIGIDKNGIERVITENCDSTFTISASQLGVGKYSAYFSVYNGSGGVDTERVEFEIVDKPKEGAVVSSSKSSYTLSDTVDISVLAYCSKGQLIGIDKEGVGRVITEEATNGNYKISASELGRGKYSAYFSVFNNSGGYDTQRVYFNIDNELTNQAISITKEEYKTDEQIEIYASAEGGVEEYNLIIYNDENEEVVNETLIGNEFAINADDLGVGNYSAKVICKNFAFSVDTETIDFSVYNDIGDINNDGTVNVIDATELQKYIAGMVTLDDDALTRADVDADGSVNIKDATLIQKYSASIITEF